MELVRIFCILLEFSRTYLNFLEAATIVWKLLDRGGLAIVAIATRLFFENARLFLRMCGILKIFSDNMRLF
jgi:hypothetical protein